MTSNSEEKVKKQIRLLVQHAMLESPNSTIIYDCKKCGWRNAFDVESTMAMENMVHLIEEIMEYAYYNKVAVWKAIVEHVRRERLERLENDDY